jgi:hypothetical protein
MVNRSWAARAARLLAMMAVFVGCLIATEAAASAKGTLVVTQSNGSQKVYHDVKIRVGKSDMSLTSSDGKGTLMIGKTDCVQVDHLLRCDAFDATLNQFGEARNMKLPSGTVWLDLSAKPQTISRSAVTVQPDGVRLSFRTEAGTTVTASGAIDQLQR